MLRKPEQSPAGWVTWLEYRLYLYLFTSFVQTWFLVSCTSSLATTSISMRSVALLHKKDMQTPKPYKYSQFQRKTISSADVIIFNAKCAKTGIWNNTNIVNFILFACNTHLRGFIFGTHGSLKAKIKQTLVQKPKRFIERAPVGFIIFYYYVSKTTLTAPLSKQDCDKVLTHRQVNLQIIQAENRHVSHQVGVHALLSEILVVLPFSENPNMLGRPRQLVAVVQSFAR